MRLLLTGQLVGAAQIARSQMERWALNLENSSQLAHQPGESGSDYYNRLWATVDVETSSFIIPEKERDTTVETRLPIANRLVSAGQLYDEVSEFLHGRGPEAAGLKFEAVDLLAAPDRGASLQVGNKILDMLELCVQRLRCCVCTCFLETGHRERAQRVFAVSNAALPSGSQPYPRWGLWPLIPRTGLSPQVMRQVRMAHDMVERVHKGERPAGRLYRNDEVSVIFFMSRRARSAEFALRNFEKEAETLGDDFDVELLSGREFDIIVTAEVLALVARWDGRQEVSAAAAVTSSGLRSAFWL